MRPVPHKKLSRAQRASGIVIMRPRNVAFLPNTMFVRVGQSWGRIHDLQEHLPSIQGFVCVGKTPAPFPEWEIDNLRSREIDGVIAGSTPAHLIFFPGDTVKVREGPLSDFQGIIDKAPDVTIQDIAPETRLRIMVQLLGRSTAVTIPAWQVERV